MNSESFDQTPKKSRLLNCSPKTLKNAATSAPYLVNYA